MAGLALANFVKEDQEPPLQPNAPVPLVEGSVSLVFRREPDSAWTSVLYVRKHLVGVQTLLDEFMQSDRKNRYYITGPPGCGKTCFLYLWARRFAVQKKKRVLILQFREKDGCFIWIREADGVLWRMNKAIEAEDLRLTFKEIIKKNEEDKTSFDLCIHDGVLDSKQVCSSMLSSLNTVVTNKLIRKVVHVTSLAFSLSTGGQRLDDNGPISRLSFDSWCLQEYESAVRSAEFVSQITNGVGNNENQLNKDMAFLAQADAIAQDDDKDGGDSDGGKESADDDDDDNDVAFDATMSVTDDLVEVVKAKYFFAGGSARFMFQFSLAKLQEELDSRMKNVLDTDWNYFAQNAVASGTPAAVNTLMQQFDNTSSPVSKYILVHAYGRCRSSLVKSLRATANSTGNPTLQGWAFELEQIDLIRTSMESEEEKPKYVTNRKGWSFHPTSQMEFDEDTFTSWAMGGASVVIWCLKWNQGCFDVAFYIETTLITVQFTLQEKHSLKPNYIRRLRKALMDENMVVDRVVHIGVRENAWEKLQFTPSTAGVGKQAGQENPEFEIEVCRSPPLELTLENDCKCDFVETKVDSSTILMYPLGRKRSRQDF